MIGKLRGLVDSTGDGFALIDVGGVGFVVYCSERALAKLPEAGQAATLLTDTVLKEDSITLYGFHNKAEQEAFRLLCTVQGVGAKVALNILSALSPDDISKAIAFEDANSFRKVSGVGPKLATRLVTELRGKDFAVSDLESTIGSAQGKLTPDREAVQALEGLGYTRTEAMRAVTNAISRSGQMPLEKLIAASLKELAA